MTKGWTKSDWRAKPRVQMPDYPDAAALTAVEAQLAKYPPLVFAGEARKLKKALAKVQAGKATDAVIDGLVPLLEQGDIVIDGGKVMADGPRDRIMEALASGRIARAA
mgnify:CR=1 FL=1